MIRYHDFVPKMTAPPGFFSPGEYETFDAALEAANAWIKENDVQVMHVETVVLPNIWHTWEEGTKDGALGTSGESPSHWHQIVRIWYRVGYAPE
ncbi:MAG: hypothetical protein WEH44_04525 [Pirellulaceae bacterium]